jgi:hypothetical protein
VAGEVTCQSGTGTSKSRKLLIKMFFKLEILFYFLDFNFLKFLVLVFCNQDLCLVKILFASYTTVETKNEILGT